MTQATRVHSTPPTNTSANNPPGAMTRDDELGMAWWNALREQERAKWSAIAGNTGRPKDAWEAFKRGSVDQTPSADPTRRRFLTTAAGASVASVGTLAIAAMPAAVINGPAACAVDPIYEAIAACRAAKQASDEAYARVNQLQKLAEERVGSGREQFEARNAFVEDILGEHPDDHGDGPAVALWDEYEAFAATVPTTLAGLFAMLAYAGEVSDHEPDVLAEMGIISTLAIAAKSLIEAQAGKAVRS